MKTRKQASHLLPDFQNFGANSKRNMLGLGIRRLHTDVDWRNEPRLAFFAEGVVPASAFCLDLDLEGSPTSMF